MKEIKPLHYTNPNHMPFLIPSYAFVYSPLRARSWARSQILQEGPCASVSPPLGSLAAARLTAAVTLWPFPPEGDQQRRRN
jgi:hypothetical protein